MSRRDAVVVAKNTRAVCFGNSAADVIVCFVFPALTTFLSTATMEDPLVQALPPATDYLTYLTLLEYQLTPERLPLLHTLLQDEKLTTNIGWDLVKLLLPMLPASTECLQDVARLGNPREVILRVSESLMQLQPEDDDDDENEDEGNSDRLPLHILQFNCLLGMLSVLHTRIQTKAPSRFMATSLQAALEAYTSMPTNETTLAFLEFLREVSPSKRPAPPPRVASESSVLRVAAASAPDPEAEVSSPSPSADNETLLVRKFIQFSLLELLKSYLLSFSSPMDPGMSWTIRMQEHLHPDLRLPGAQSQTDVYRSTKELKERDMIMGKLVVCIAAEIEISGINRSANRPLLTRPFPEMLDLTANNFCQSFPIQQQIKSLSLILTNHHRIPIKFPSSAMALFFY
jgi:hypothetical protein